MYPYSDRTSYTVPLHDLVPWDDYLIKTFDEQGQFRGRMLVMSATLRWDPAGEGMGNVMFHTPATMPVTFSKDFPIAGIGKYGRYQVEDGRVVRPRQRMLTKLGEQRRSYGVDLVNFGLQLGTIPGRFLPLHRIDINTRSSPHQPPIPRPRRWSRILEENNGTEWFVDNDGVLEDERPLCIQLIRQTNGLYEGIITQGKPDDHPRRISKAKNLPSMEMGQNWLMHVHRQHLADKENDRTILRWLDACRPGGVLIDVGASTGRYTTAMAKKASLVYAFEPHPLTLICLESMMEGIPNVVLIPKALSNECGPIKFWSAEKWGCHTSAKSQTETNDFKVNSADPCHQVEALTLNRFMTEYHISNLAGLKIDVEGAEQAVLEGGWETLLRDGPPLALELHHGANFGAITQLLRTAGYQVDDELLPDHHYLFVRRVS